jgi:hypothetical protein
LPQLRGVALGALVRERSKERGLPALTVRERTKERGLPALTDECLRVRARRYGL